MTEPGSHDHSRGDVSFIAEALMARVADRFAVLGQIARLRLIEHLAHGPATPRELADALGLTQQNVSKHLQILHRNGLVSRRPEGSSVIYDLKDESTMRLLQATVVSVAEHLREMSALAAGMPVDKQRDSLAESPASEADDA